jgi:hypothetical protein
MNRKKYLNSHNNSYEQGASIYDKFFSVSNSLIGTSTHASTMDMKSPNVNLSMKKYRYKKDRARSSNNSSVMGKLNIQSEEIDL